MARGGFAPRLDPAVSLLLKLERADAEQLPRCSDHCGAAPIRVGRRRKDRLVQHVLPIAGKFLLGDDARRDRALASPHPGHDDAIVDPCPGRAADRQRGRVEPRQRLHQTEAGLLVIRKSVALDRGADARAEPDRFRFRDEVSDREHEPAIADHHAVPGALSSEHLCGKTILRYHRAQAHHGADRNLEVEGVVGGTPLVVRRPRPIPPAPRKPMPVNTPWMTRLVASTERTPSPPPGATARTAMALASPTNPRVRTPIGLP